MKIVGLRELKNRLSGYVRHVRSGQAVVVTKVDPALLMLANRGLLILGAPNAGRIYPPQSRLLRSTTSAKLLEAERGPGSWF